MYRRNPTQEAVCDVLSTVVKQDGFWVIFEDFTLCWTTRPVSVVVVQLSAFVVHNYSTQRFFRGLGHKMHAFEFKAIRKVAESALDFCDAICACASHVGNDSRKDTRFPEESLVCVAARGWYTKRTRPGVDDLVPVNPDLDLGASSGWYAQSLSLGAWYRRSWLTG